MNNLHTLSIRLMPGGFCFSVSKSEQTFVNIVPGADFEQRLKQAILNLEISVGEDEVECYVETARTSLSPAKASDEVLAEQMFVLTLCEAEKEEKILHETNQDGDVRVSFGIDSNLYNFLVRTYQYINFHHPIIEIIDAEARRTHPTENWMTAFVSQSSLFLLAYKDRKLQLANCVETMVTQNRAYHILNTWTLLGLDVLLDTLYIIGKEEDKEKLCAAVSNFIKHCE